MKTNHLKKAIQWVASIFDSMEKKMARELDGFPDRLNDLYHGLNDQVHLINEMYFEAEQFRNDNPEIDFSNNGQKKIYMLAHFWIIVLIVFCTAADFYIMREVAGQFGISDPRFGFLLGLGLLTIELTLAALAIKRIGSRDMTHIVNQIGKYLFLLFIPSMCYLTYRQNVDNVAYGEMGMSMDTLELKMILISSFSLLIHLLLVVNLEKGFKSYCDMKTLKKDRFTFGKISSHFTHIRNIVREIQLTGSRYLIARERYNAMFPAHPKKLEFLSDGLISLIDDGMGEDVIRLKQVPLTQVKKGFARGDMFRLTLSKSKADQYALYLRERNGQMDQVPARLVVPVRSNDEITTEHQVKPDERGLQYDQYGSYESFFGNKDKEV